MSDDSSLAEVVDFAATDNVRADSFFCPAFDLRLANVVALSLSSVLEFRLEPFVVVVRLLVFSERNA